MKKSALNTFVCNYTPIEKLFLNLSKDTPNEKDSYLSKKISILDFIKDHHSSLKHAYSINNNSPSHLLKPNVSDTDSFVTFHGNDIAFSRQARFFLIPEHSHSFIEMLYIHSGHCIQTINGKQIRLKQGEVCLVGPNVSHSIEPAGENDIFINCLMPVSYLNNIMLSRLSGNDLFSNFFIQCLYNANKCNNYILFHSENSRKFNQLMKDVLCEYFDKSRCSAEIINSHMVLIFAELLDVYVTNMNNENYNILKGNNISEIILFIQNNFQDATLSSVAEHFYFHPNYLSNLIKKLTGKNFKDFIHEAKLKKACFLLENSNLTTSEISRKVGYENVKFFYKLFKKYYHKTPGDYRKEKRGTQ